MRYVITLAIFALLIFAAPLHAQTNPQGTQIEGKFNPEDFENLADRAESVLTNASTSAKSLEILRTELFFYRSQALDQQGGLSDQLAEIETAIEELGAPPASDAPPEPPAIAEQRSNLEAERNQVREPYLILRQSYRRADVLIKRIDALISEQEQARLYTAGPLPLAPANINDASIALRTYWNALSGEITRNLANPINSQTRSDSSLEIALYLLVGLTLLLAAPIALSRAIGRNFALHPGRRQSINAIVLAVLLITLPIGGGLALAATVELLDILLLRGLPLLQAIISIVINLTLILWLMRYMFFADSPFAPHFDDNSDGKTGGSLRACRALLIAIAVLVALSIMLLVLTESEDWTAEVVSVLNFPLTLAGGAVLWGIATQLRGFYAKNYAGDRGEDYEPPTETFLPFVINTSIALLPLIAIGAIFGAAVGYGNLAEFVTSGIVHSLILIGITYVLFGLLVGVLGAFTDPAQEETKKQGGLYRSLLGLVLIALSVPAHALFWGASFSDITDVWRTFQEGIIIGDIQFSSWDALSFLMIFTVGFVATRMLQATLRGSILPNTRIDEGAQNAIVTGLGYMGIFAAAVIAITSTGLDLSNLAIVAGALSVGIGFGLQTVVSNFVSGIILLIERPIKLGDWVEVGAHSGNVRKISVRSTEIETFDRASVIVPNADLIGGVVTNWTHANNNGRVIIPIGVGYDSDVERVREILLEVVRGHDLILKRPEPNVYFMRFGADALEFEVRAILRDVTTVIAVSSDLNFAIIKRLRKEGIEIPFAQRDVTIKNPEALGAVKSKPRAVKAKKPRVAKAGKK